MKKTVLKYGLSAGAFLGLITAVVVPLCLNRGVKGWDSQLLGYTVMLLAFLAIFFGIRAYREHEGGGAITFGKALQVGVLIALVASTCYVAGWQIAYWGFIPDFGDKYAAMTLAKMRANGATETEMAKATQQMETFMRLYKNPVYNVLITYVEVLPLGILVSLISAAILRKKPDAGFAPAAV